jgi:4a-hydroxytetrahydrobiopterin dehydratase
MKPLTPDEIQQELENFTNWTYEDDAIHLSLEFDDFKNAFTAMTRMAFEAERLAHHPNWSNTYNTVNISLSTHDAGGITHKDFKLAKAFETALGQ